MRSWFAIIVAPLVALGVQSALFAMVTPACANQVRLPLHLVAFLGLAVTVLLAALPRAGAGTADPTRKFLARVGTAVAALSALVVLAMWFGVWMLSPCDPWP